MSETAFNNTTQNDSRKIGDTRTEDPSAHSGDLLSNPASLTTQHVAALAHASVQNKSETRTSYKETIVKAVDKSFTLFNQVFETFAKKGVHIPEPVYRHTLTAAASRVRQVMIEDMKKHKPKDLLIEENLHRRAFSEILEEGIMRYKNRNPHGELYYQKNDEYVSFTDFVRCLNQEINEDDVVENEMLNPHKNKTILRAIAESFVHGKNDSFWPIISHAIQKYLPHNFLSKTRNSENHMIFTETNPRDLANLIKIIGETTESSKQSQPISTSMILAHALEKTRGNLARALKLTSDCLKYATRPYQYVSEENEDIEDQLWNIDYQGPNLGTEWIWKLIVDEYSDICAYDKLPKKERAYPGELHEKFVNSPFGMFIDSEDSLENIKYYDFSLANQVGKPYHAAYMSALLDSFPAEMVFTLVLGEYAKYGHRHGLSKFLADLRVAADLRRTEEVLKKYEKN